MIIDSYQKFDDNDGKVAKYLNEEEILHDDIDAQGRYTYDDLVVLKKIAREIIKKNHAGKVLSRYDYFMLGGLDFPEASSKVYFMHLDKKFRGFEYTMLKKFFSIQLNIDSSKKYDYIMKTHYQFGDYVISDEEKVQIWNNLLASGIDRNNIDDLVFSGAVRAYAKEHGLIKVDNSKKLVKSK